MVRLQWLKVMPSFMMLPGWKGKAGSSVLQALLCLLLHTMALVSLWALKKIDVEVQVVAVRFSTKLLALEVTVPQILRHSLGLRFRLLVTTLPVMTDRLFLNPLYQLTEDSP